jgi:hypothetical protein
MSRATIALAALVAAIALIMAASSAGRPAGRHLDAVFGPGTFQITLKENGEPVTSLRPGTYWLTVHDTSTAHNFHLIGPDLASPDLDEVLTTVLGTGDVTVKVHLTHGTYRLRCDPHWATRMMFVDVAVGGAGQIP